jgi:hypothetical protein
MGMESITFYSNDDIISVDVTVEMLQQHPDWYLSEIYRNNLIGNDPTNHTIRTTLTVDEILDWQDHLNKPIVFVDSLEQQIQQPDGNFNVSNQESNEHHVTFNNATEIPMKTEEDEEDGEDEEEEKQVLPIHMTNNEITEEFLKCIFARCFSQIK